MVKSFLYLAVSLLHLYQDGCDKESRNYVIKSIYSDSIFIIQFMQAKIRP